jgi:hypothetical protein
MSYSLSAVSRAWRIVMVPAPVRGGDYFPDSGDPHEPRRERPERLLQGFRACRQRLVAVAAPVALGNWPGGHSEAPGGNGPPGRIMRARNTFTLSGVSASSSTQAALRPRGFLAVTMATVGCSAGRLLLLGFTSRWTIAGAAFALGATIAGPSNGTAFRFRGGRL